MVSLMIHQESLRNCWKFLTKKQLLLLEKKFFPMMHFSAIHTKQKYRVEFKLYFVPSLQLNINELPRPASKYFLA